MLPLPVAIQVCLIQADCSLGGSCLAAGLCELHFGAIIRVSVGTNCLRSFSVSGSLSEILGLKASTLAEHPSAPLSLFHSLFPPLLFLFVYNSPSPAHTLFHLSDVRKIKGFAVVTGVCRHNIPPTPQLVVVWTVLGM